MNRKTVVFDNHWEYTVVPHYNSNSVNKTSKGWVCPKCGTVNAPWMPFCYNCFVLSEKTEVKIYYSCDKCGKKFDSIVDLLNHILKEHIR